MNINNECWVSGYRNHIFADDNGGDSFGYYFIIKLAADKYKKYRVLFVSTVSDPIHTQISLSPNLFPVDGTKIMRVVGSGSMKFLFHKKVPKK